MRFSLKSSLICTAIAAAILSTLFAAPRVSLSSKFIEKHTLSDGATTFNVTMVATNNGILPLWYKKQINVYDPYSRATSLENYALGSTIDTKSGWIEHSNAKWAPWMILLPRDSVRVCQVLRVDEFPGVRFQNWNGRSHNSFDKNITKILQTKIAR